VDRHCFDADPDLDPDLDRHQNRKSDPGRYQNDADTDIRSISDPPSFWFDTFSLSFLFFVLYEIRAGQNASSNIGCRIIGAFF
jgi:hypothetical protein